MQGVVHDRVPHEPHQELPIHQPEHPWGVYPPAGHQDTCLGQGHQVPRRRTEREDAKRQGRYCQSLGTVTAVGGLAGLRVGLPGFAPVPVRDVAQHRSRGRRPGAASARGSKTG